VVLIERSAPPAVAASERCLPLTLSGIQRSDQIMVAKREPFSVEAAAEFFNHGWIALRGSSGF